MNDYIAAGEGAIRYGERQAQKFQAYRQKVQILLANNPQGLTIQAVQTAARLSHETTKRILKMVATEQGGKFYQKEGV